MQRVVEGIMLMLSQGIFSHQCLSSKTAQHVVWVRIFAYKDVFLRNIYKIKYIYAAEIYCMCNCHDTTQQNFVKLCSNNGHPA